MRPVGLAKLYGEGQKVSLHVTWYVPSSVNKSAAAFGLRLTHARPYASSQPLNVLDSMPSDHRRYQCRPLSGPNGRCSNLSVQDNRREGTVDHLESPCDSWNHCISSAAASPLSSAHTEVAPSCQRSSNPTLRSSLSRNVNRNRVLGKRPWTSARLTVDVRTRKS